LEVICEVIAKGFDRLPRFDGESAMLEPEIESGHLREIAYYYFFARPENSKALIGGR
jgi:hypothetical protein